MKKSLKTLLMAGLFVFAFASPVLAATTPVVSAVSAKTCSDSDNLLGMPAWYRGIINTTDCSIKGPDTTKPTGLSDFIWKIALNIIQIALVAMIYVAVFFILYGGFQFITGGSNPSMIEKGRKTILNAVIGLVIGLGSVAILNMLFTGIFGSTATSTSNGISGLVDMSGNQLLTNALNMAYFAAGTIAVVVIIIAGLMYATSAGDSGRVTKAKNLITYAIVGLIVVLTAFVITSFVIGRFK